MPNLRDMLDGNTITAAAPKAVKPSPVAQHVSDHIQDPFSSTKEGFEKLGQKKLEYQMEQENMMRQLAPVKSVIDHVEQMHQLNNDNPDQVDEAGNPVNMGQTPGQMNTNRPSQAGFKPGVAPGFSGNQVVPQKMGMAAPGGKSAQNSPQPKGQGATFNPQAQPPKGNRTMPGAKGPGDNKVQNKTAKAQDKSSRAIKVHVTANSDVGVIKGGSRRLSSTLGLESLRTSTVNAAVDYSDGDVRQLLQEALNEKNGTSNCSSPCAVSTGYTYIRDIFTDAKYFVYEQKGKMYRQNYKLSDGSVTLTGDPIKVKTAYVKAAMSFPRGGTTSPVRVSPGRISDTGSMPSGGRPGGNMGRGVSLRGKGKKVKAGPDALSDKVSERGSDLAYNPVMKGGKTCKGCGMMKANCKCMNAKGHSLGAKKGWTTRGKGHLSKTEKASHYKTMDAGGPGSGRRPGFGTGKTAPDPTLAKYGWSSRGASSPATRAKYGYSEYNVDMYKHSSHPGHSLVKYDDGSWEHVRHTSGGGVKTIAKGNSEVDMNKHLSSYRRR